MNKHVGEKEIKISEEKSLKCRPDFQAICEIETMTNSSIVKLFDSFASGTPKFNDVLSIIHACHRAYDERSSVTRREIGEHILEYGLMNVAAPAFELISNVLSGGETEKKTQPKNQKK